MDQHRKGRERGERGGGRAGYGPRHIHYNPEHSQCLTGHPALVMDEETQGEGDRDLA